MTNSSKKRITQKTFLKKEKPFVVSQQTQLRSDLTSEKCKRYVRERLSQLTPILQKVAMGDFSENVVIPEKEDEFTELLTSLNLTIDDLKELTEAQEKARAEIEKKRIIKKTFIKR